MFGDDDTTPNEDDAKKEDKKTEEKVESKHDDSLHMLSEVFKQSEMASQVIQVIDSNKLSKQMVALI